MSKYILVYNINDFPECGGGIQVETFRDDDDGKSMHKRVNDLAKKHKTKFNILEAGKMCIEFEYDPVEVVTEFNPIRK